MSESQLLAPISYIWRQHPSDVQEVWILAPEKYWKYLFLRKMARKSRFWINNQVFGFAAGRKRPKTTKYLFLGTFSDIQRPRQHFYQKKIRDRLNTPLSSRSRSQNMNPLSTDALTYPQVPITAQKNLFLDRLSIIKKGRSIIWF